MTQNRHRQIRSAAFKQSKMLNPEQQPPLSTQRCNIIADLRCSQSRFFVKNIDQEEQVRRKWASERFSTLRTSPSLNSQIWRQVHSTRSQFRLRSLHCKGIESEPVRKNLLEKVDRIKNKNRQRQIEFQNCRNVIQRKALKKVRMAKDQDHKRGVIEQKIWELLIPFERAKQSSQERYRFKLLKIRKV